MRGGGGGGRLPNVRYTGMCHRPWSIFHFQKSRTGPQVLRFYSRTGSFFDNLNSNAPAQISKISVAFGFCFLQPDVIIFVLLYLSKVFQAFYNWDKFESGHMYSSLNLT